MNILVTGANGQLGTEIRNLSEGMGHHFIFSDVSEVPGRETVYLDITNPDAIRIVCRSEDVDVIVNCAAYTDVARAEDDIDFAALLNHTAPGHLAAVAREIGATLIHISTDYVFHGDASVPYREEDVPQPLGVYGATKLQGEEAVRVALFPVREEFRQDGAPPDGGEAGDEVRLRPGGHADLCR